MKNSRRTLLLGAASGTLLLGGCGATVPKRDAQADAGIRNVLVVSMLHPEVRVYFHGFTVFGNEAKTFTPSRPLGVSIDEAVVSQLRRARPQWNVSALTDRTKIDDAVRSKPVIGSFQEPDARTATRGLFASRSDLDLVVAISASSEYFGELPGASLAAMFNAKASFAPRANVRVMLIDRAGNVLAQRVIHWANDQRELEKFAVAVPFDALAITTDVQRRQATDSVLGYTIGALGWVLNEMGY
jgi:hypothetical protein